MTTPQRLAGTVKRVIVDKGFGFLAAAGTGTEYFFHKSATSDFSALYEGAPVTFLPTTGPKGPRAEQVEAVDSFDP